MAHRERNDDTHKESMVNREREGKERKAYMVVWERGWCTGRGTKERMEHRERGTEERMVHGEREGKERMVYRQVGERECNTGRRGKIMERTVRETDAHGERRKGEDGIQGGGGERMLHRERGGNERMAHRERGGN